jgi:dihydrodipicolinate synthase/N-acetylneuraminate lyase
VGAIYNEPMLLEGIFAAITTPFYSDGRLYWRKLEHNTERYSRTPLSGVVVLGSTGEAVMLSDDESREVLKAVSRSASAEKVLIAGVARESVAETLRLADFAAEQRYDAVLVRTPHYYGPQMRPAEMLNFYRMVADRSALPVVLYSIPKFTHYELPVEVVVELAAHPNIIGLKDSSGSLERMAVIAEATRSAPKRMVMVTQVFAAVTARMLVEAVSGPANFVPAGQLGADSSVAVAVPVPKTKIMRKREVGFQLLTGSAEKLKASLDAGATGAVLGMAACAPQACLEIYAAWKENDPALADEKQQRIVQASKRVGGELGIPGLKYACDLNGYYGLRPRLPLLPLTGAEQAEVDLLMADLRN